VPLGAAGLWLLRSFDPSSAHSVFPPCVFHLLTGLHCPGCGLTRALHALAHGDVARAWAMHPLLLLALPALAAMAGQWLWGRSVLPASANRWLYDGRAWIAALLLFGVLRNLPWSGVAWMAPG
jgi:hypothetical protein